jgi:AcrR family transcriptional regulator
MVRWEPVSVKGSRRYLSPLREESARNTRRAILAAARDLFVRQGFVATTMDQIAQQAGVSKPTVFATAGNKRSLLKEIRDVAIAGDDEPIPIKDRGWYQEMLAEPDPRRSLRLYARNVSAINDRYADIDEVLQAAAGADQELRDLWNTGEAERLKGAEVVVANLGAKVALRRDQKSAIDIVWILTAPEQLRRLVRLRGWSLQDYEDWLTETLCTQLL